MAIIQFPPEVRHPEVEEFILSHFSKKRFHTYTVRSRKICLQFLNTQTSQILDLALIQLTGDGYIGYQINSALSLLTGEFIKSFETVDPKDSLLGLTGYQPVDEAKVYQDKFRLYWRPQKQDPFEWLKERGLYVI